MMMMGVKGEGTARPCIWDLGLWGGGGGGDIIIYLAFERVQRQCTA